MAKRRTQRVQRFKDGGAVRGGDDLPGFGREIEPPAAPDIPPPPSPPHEDAVTRALEAQRNAERLQAERQRAAPQQQSPQAPPTIEEQVAAMPWSDRRKAFFLEHHAELLQNPQAIPHYERMARDVEGITDEAEIDRYVLDGVRWEKALRERRLEQARAAAAPPAPPQGRQEPPPPPPMPMLEPRRSMPMAAPVQREVPSYSGAPASSSGKMRLTEEERRIARESFVDRPDMPKLTNAQKEFLYAKNKARYEEMKRTGEYTDQRQR